MSGHSKWKNIMHKKGKTDAERARVFSKLGKEMMIAIREGGSDPAANSRLRDCIVKAKANNVPNDNIERIIKKAEGGGVNYEAIVYEGYGPSGIAVIVETATDNRNRTGSDMRHYFDKYGGKLGNTGCVSYLFADSGIIVIELDGKDEEALMEAAMEAGAVDFTSSDGVFEIFTAPAELERVRDALSGAGYSFLSAQVEKVPSNYVRLESEEDIQKATKLLEMFEEHDDVQNVWHNWEV